MAPIVRCDALSQRLLAVCQRDFPLDPQPYRVLAERLDTTEAEVLAAFHRLRDQGVLSRIGAVYRPRAAGASTLAAMAVPPERLDVVAALVDAVPEVNHNYERDHTINLWFVVTAPDQERLDAVLADIQARSGLVVLDLPMLDGYHLDLGFALTWD